MHTFDTWCNVECACTSKAIKIHGRGCVSQLYDVNFGKRIERNGWQEILRLDGRAKVGLGRENERGFIDINEEILPS